MGRIRDRLAGNLGVANPKLRCGKGGLVVGLVGYVDSVYILDGVTITTRRGVK